MSHPSKALWASHHPPSGYPAGVLPVPEPITGRAFFPGGYGLWGASQGKPLPAFPIGGIMVLGHDFHSESGYAESLRLGGERDTIPTWRNLLKLFEQVGVNQERCFFTNFYMGLRAGSATTGTFPGANDPIFVAHCTTFLLHQITAQRPTLILTLGTQVPPAIGRLSPELSPWAAGRGLKHLDAVGPVQYGVTFPEVENFRTTAVALIHPSLRHASLRLRRYHGAVGAEAELTMLRKGLAASAG